MDFESNDEINSENTRLDLNGPSGSLVDAHFDFQEFLGSDAASYDPATETSVSSGSPPAQEWQSTWMDASLDAQVTSLSADPMLFDFSALNNMGMGMNLSIPEMFTTHTSNYQAMLNPSDLHKAPTQLPTYSHVPPQTIVPGKEFLGATPDEDIIAVVKRMTGITSAQVAGAPSDFAPDLRDFYSAAQGFSDNSNSCSSASSDRSSVPPQGSDIAQPVSPSEDNGPEMTIGPSGRPKTAHTTIERRYRTNLNTCITSLRNSIPAVRYLDKQYQKESAVPDTLDENGCVDGVKAARKISKATIMGKAREYIVVLRKRETKLQRELEGMKELVASLVGGPLLLQEWERQWAARQAQEADDEMEGEEMDSGDEEDEDSADERPRKRAKLASVPVPPTKLKKPSPKPTVVAPASSMNDEAKIPKKRGRPPKNSAARQSISISPTVQYPVGAALPSGDVKPNINAQSMQTYTFVSNLTQQRKPAYLLASFVFMSFFKPSSRMPTHVHEHSHTGTVLTSAFDSQPAVDNSVWHSHPVLHVLHSAIMVVLFVALAFSLAPQPVQSAIWAYLTKRFGYESSSNDKATADIPAALLASPASVMSFAEKELKESVGGPKIKAKLYNALQLTTGSTPTSDQLGIMALLHFSAKPSEAVALWKNAAALCSATSNTRSAYSMPLARAVETVKNTFHDPRSPLVIVASKVIEERIERMLCDMFVNDVVSICQTSDSASDCATVTGPESSTSRRARTDLVKQAREVGGKPAEIVLEWDLALSGKLATAKDGSNTSSSSKSLLNALSLMRRVFPGSGVSSRDDSTINGLPSPPPSPLLQEELVKMERILRIALDSKVFHGYHGSVVTEGELEKEKERERSEDVRKARDLLVTRLSQTARLRRLAALDDRD